MGGLPLICFMPETILKESKEKVDKNRIKIHISKHITKSFKLFIDRHPESVIVLTRSHESLI